MTDIVVTSGSSTVLELASQMVTTIQSVPLAPIIDQAIGLLDMTPDALPVLDGGVGIDGLVGESPSLPLGAFAHGRFAGVNAEKQAPTLYG